MLLDESAMPLRPWNGEENIPVAEWGRDHWSTLAYIETCCVDGSGKLVNDRMRTYARRHRELMGYQLLKLGSAATGDYPTRLAAGMLVQKHDDWDCLNDAVAAGYVEILEARDSLTHRMFGALRVRVKLTADGIRVCGLLRAHKARGGNFGNFIPEGVN